MWINLDIGLSTEEIINYLKSLPKTNAPIYLSLNTMYPANEVFRLLPELLAELQSSNLNIKIGPHFVEEGCIFGEKVENIDELYFFTQGEKALWYIRKYSLPADIDTIIFLGVDLGIEPLIIKMKDKRDCYKYYFVQREPIATDIAKLINKKSWVLSRIKDKRD